MPCKIFINIDSKSASTALQSNFYPVFKINYIGRNYKEIQKFLTNYMIISRVIEYY